MRNHRIIIRNVAWYEPHGADDDGVVKVGAAPIHHFLHLGKLLIIIKLIITLPPLLTTSSIWASKQGILGKYI